MSESTPAIRVTKRWPKNRTEFSTTYAIVEVPSLGVSFTCFQRNGRWESSAFTVPQGERYPPLRFTAPTAYSALCDAINAVADPE